MSENPQELKVAQSEIEILSKNFFLLKLIVSQKWNSKLFQKSSKNFQNLATILESEMMRIFPKIKFKLLDVKKLYMKSNEIFVTFGCESEIEAEEFGQRLKIHIYHLGKLRETKTSLAGLGVMNVSEDEIRHFKKYGYRKCEKCVSISSFQPSISGFFTYDTLRCFSIVCCLILFLALLTWFNSIKFKQQQID